MGKCRSNKARKANARISLRKRQELVALVERSGLSIRKAAKKVGIKLSTAKLIVLRFKRTGTYHIRREDRLSLPQVTLGVENLRNGDQIEPAGKEPQNWFSPINRDISNIPAFSHYIAGYLVDWSAYSPFLWNYSFFQAVGSHYPMFN